MSGPLSIEQLTVVIDELRKEQAEMRSELKKNSELTSEIAELFATAKGAFKFFGWIGSAVKWVGGIAVAAGAIYAFVYSIIHGFPPK